MTRNHEAIVEEMQRVLKEKTKRFAFKKLEREIIKTGACVECGACVAGCPVNAISGERPEGKYIPTLTGECTSCGICYAMCPRTFVLQDQLIGEVSAIWKIRSIREHKKQDGGAVTALLQYMLTKKMIDGAVVACKSPDKPWLPITKLVTKSEDLQQCGGTIYSHAQVIHELLKGFESNLTSLAVVGTACNIEAVKRMEEHPAGFLRIDKQAKIIKINLFCMESFNHKDVVNFLEQAGIKIADVTRFAIAGGKFTVNVGSDEQSWPVAELGTAASSSCAYCQDFTGKHSDLSCGNIGSDEGWTTVLVRTERGANILKGALKEAFIEGELLEADALVAVMNSARFKMNKYYKLDIKH
jgi:coenzyme F420 hydrogenase subunit beta